MREWIPAATRREVLGERPVCAHCGTRRGPWDVDHVVPVKAGGDYKASNLQPSCRSCNRRRQDKPLERRREWVKFSEKQLRQVMALALVR